MLFLFLIFVLIPVHGWATQFYVEPPGTSGCATPVATNYDPTIRSCGSSGTFTVYSTPDDGAGAMVAGDTLTIRGGTYTGLTATIRRMPSGNSASAPTIVEGEPTDLPGCALAHTCHTILHPSTSPSGGGITNNAVVVSHAIIRKIDFDHQNISNNSYPFRIASNNGSKSGTCTDVLVEDIEAHSTLNQTPTFNVSGVQVDGLCTFITIRRLHSHDNGGVPNTGGHGIYLQGDDVTVQDSWFHDNGDFGVQCYRSGTENGGIPFRCYFYNNLFENNESHLAIEGQNFKAVGNVFRNPRGGTNIIVGFGSSQSPLIYNNLFYSSSGGITGILCGQYGGCTNATIVNNIIFGYSSNAVTLTGTGTALLMSNNACEAAKSCGTTGKLSISAITDVLISTTDYTLKQGSSAIDAGTTSLTERPCNGTCDIGPNESFTYSSGSITANTVEVTLGMSTNTPVIPTTAGWSVACTPNPTACPTPSITAISLKTGTSSVVSITYSGTACAAGQTWTVSYSASTGATTDSITLPLKQELSTFTTQALTNGCTGSGSGSYPAGALVYHPLDGDATDSSGNANNGTLTGSPTFSAAKHGTGMVTVSGSTQYDAIPYGNAINPSTQALTICFGAYITPGTEGSVNFIAFGAPVGTNQRFYVAATAGTWRLAAQNQNSGTASDLAVVAGWNFVCILGDGAGHLTLYNNNVAATTGIGVRTVTSYTLAGNFQLGAISGNTSGSAIYDELLIWTSAKTISSIYSVWEPNASITSQFSQKAHKFQGVFLLANGSVEDLSDNNANRNVVDGGAVAIIFQINCDNVADCAPTSFNLRYSIDGTNFNLSVPNTPTADGVYFWGTSVTSSLNNGTATGPLTGALTHTNGPTLITADSIPNEDLAQNTSLTLRYIVRFSTGLSGQSRYFKLYDQSGNAFTGGYTPSTGAKVIIVPISFGSGF